MAKEFSLDIVSDYDIAEMTNAVDQARREIANRYDFKNTPANIDFLSKEKNGVRIEGESRYQLDAVLDVFHKKLVKRGVPLATLDVPADPNGSGKILQWDIAFKKGLGKEEAKQINQIIKDQRLKVKTQVQDQTIRVTSPSKDELQAVMSVLKAKEFNFPLQFVNFR